jgi:hypothetical protein
MATIQIEDLPAEGDDVGGFTFSSLYFRYPTTTFSTRTTFSSIPLPGGRTTDLGGLMGVRG